MESLSDDPDIETVIVLTPSVDDVSAQTAFPAELLLWDPDGDKENPVPLQLKVTVCPDKGRCFLSITTAVIISEEILSDNVIPGDGTVIVTEETEDGGLLFS